MIHQLDIISGYWHSKSNTNHQSPIKRIWLILGFSLILLVWQSISNVFAATPCLLCHKGLSAEQVTGWEQSAHAESLDSLKASPDAEDACLECHSVDYQLDPANVTLDTAKLSNGCGSCHADHKEGFSDIGSDLLKPANELCNDCHTAGDAKPGGTPPSAQLEIFTGTGGIGVPDSPSIHGFMKDGCLYCHTPSMKTETGEKIAHTFEANTAVCTSCHTPEAITKAKEEIEIELAELTKLLEEFPNKESQEYEDAKFNIDLVNISGDFGAHNFEYSQSLLEYSKSILQGQQTEFPAWDVNQDGAVDISDLIIIGNHFGEEIKDSPTPNPDVNGDGTVDISDLVIVGIHFGE